MQVKLKDLDTFESVCDKQWTKVYSARGFRQNPEHSVHQVMIQGLSKFWGFFCQKSTALRFLTNRDILNRSKQEVWCYSLGYSPDKIGITPDLRT